MEAKFLQVGNQQLAYYERDGQGPTIVLVHGNSSSGATFRPQFEGTLGERFRLLAIDLPGHGESPPATDPATTYNLPGYARLIAGAAEALGATRGIFVGWSLGGHIVLEASTQLPEAAGFLIYGTPPIAFPPDMANAFLPHPAMAAGFTDQVDEAQAEAYAQAFFRPGVTDVPPAFKADILRTDGRARSGLASSIAPNGYTDEVALVAGMKAPLAILHGADEQLVSLPYMQALSMPTLWRGSIQVVPNTSHALHWEDPEAFNSLVEAFAREVTG